MKNAHFLLLYILLLSSFYSIGQLDEQGWTILDPSKASKIIYVSTSDGDNSTGTVYPFPSATIGEDPIHPIHTITPFQTLDAALAQVSHGEAAWILLKRGDTFYETLRPKSGKSRTEPMVITSYGNRTEAPVLKTGKERGMFTTSKGYSHSWIIGLTFYAHTRDPDGSEYVNSDGTGGMFLYSNANFITEHILIEGCTFKYYSGCSIQAAGTTRNITLRRNLFLNNYSTSSHSQGLFAHNVSDITLEENIFDHNGWYTQSYTNNGKEEGQATIFNHNTYFADVHNVTFKGNSFYRASSVGNKWTANEGIASTTNVTIQQNFYHDGEVGITIGGNDREGPYRFKDITITDNVFNSLGLSQPTNRTLSWGIEIDDWDNGIFAHNIFTHQKNQNLNIGIGVILKGENRSVDIQHNIFNELEGTRGIDVQTTQLQNTRIHNNAFRLSLSHHKHFVQMKENVPSLFENNRYTNLGNRTDVFRIGVPSGTSLSYEAWVNASGETGSSTEPLAYPDPSRSLERYVTEVLKLDGLETFYQELRKQSMLYWRPEYTALAINAWIKEGFGIETDTPPNVTPPVTPDPDTEPDTEPDTNTDTEPEEAEENGALPIEGIESPSDVDNFVFYTYPNPLQNRLIVQGDMKGKLRLYTANGQLLSTRTFKEEDTIDLSGLSTGTYYIQWTDERSKKIVTRQYVKN